MEWFTKNANFATFAGSIVIFMLLKWVSFFTLLESFFSQQQNQFTPISFNTCFSLLKEVEGDHKVLYKRDRYLSQTQQPESVGGWQKRSYVPCSSSSVPPVFQKLVTFQFFLLTHNFLPYFLIHHQLQVSSWHELQTAGTVTKLRQGLLSFFFLKFIFPWLKHKLTWRCHFKK